MNFTHEKTACRRVFLGSHLETVGLRPCGKKMCGMVIVSMIYPMPTQSPATRATHIPLPSRGKIIALEVGSICGSVPSRAAGMKG